MASARILQTLSPATPAVLRALEIRPTLQLMQIPHGSCLVFRALARRWQPDAGAHIPVTSAWQRLPPPSNT
jgi:hypothetical protein